MCVRCLKEGFVDDFPWPVHRNGAEEEEEEETAASTDRNSSGIFGRMTAVVFSYWIGIRGILPFDVELRYILPTLLCGSMQKWEAAVGFNTLLFTTLALSCRRLHARKAAKGMATKIRNNTKNIVLCSVISSEAASRHVDNNINNRN